MSPKLPGSVSSRSKHFRSRKGAEGKNFISQVHQLSSWREVDQQPTKTLRGITFSSSSTSKCGSNGLDNPESTLNSSTRSSTLQTKSSSSSSSSKSKLRSDSSENAQSILSSRTQSGTTTEMHQEPIVPEVSSSFLLAVRLSLRKSFTTRHAMRVEVKPSRLSKDSKESSNMSSIGSSLDLQRRARHSNARSKLKEDNSQMVRKACMKDMHTNDKTLNTGKNFNAHHPQGSSTIKRGKVVSAKRDDHEPISKVKTAKTGDHEPISMGQSAVSAGRLTYGHRATTFRKPLRTITTTETQNYKVEVVPKRITKVEMHPKKVTNIGKSQRAFVDGKENSVNGKGEVNPKRITNVSKSQRACVGGKEIAACSIHQNQKTSKCGLQVKTGNTLHDKKGKGSRNTETTEGRTVNGARNVYFR
ncbi:uncharacterized protein DDB_G0271670 [Amborella trichopoda]|uniref:uncharacterized protein DDB_G0271670 n=1 Tax=Amborella trichopoda TaxID=13333 RepID=UPI0005D3926A|nr:uncharacterized protein DDB_G0271670 [Amborella trichopoda]|eukprot:XP_011622341.1 uncharacterized protein DDB_G0271670 [Amborella trichopoda]